MARPIDIPIISDVKGFLRGTDDVVEALEDVSDALDDVGTDAESAGRSAGDGLAEGVKGGVEEIERYIQDAADDIAKRFGEGLEQGRPFDELVDEAKRATTEVAREAEQMAERVEGSAEKLERSFKEAFDAADQNGAVKLRKVGDSAEDGFNRAKEGAEEFKQSSQESAEEVASSFDGSFESIGDGAQEVLSEAFAGFGPAGAAAGLAAAAGLGAVIGAFQRSKEEAQAAREEIAEVVGELNAIRFDGASAIETLASRMRELVEATEEGATSLEDIKTISESIGQESNFDEFVQAIAGSPEAYEQATAALREFIEAQKEQDELAASESRINVRSAQARQLLEIIEEEGAAQQEARDQQQLLIDAGIEDIQRRVEQEERAAERLEEVRQRDIEEQEEVLERARQINQERANDVTTLTDAWTEHFNKITEDDKITVDELNASLDQMIADQTTKIANWTWATSNLTREQMLSLEAFGEDRHEVLETLMNTPPDLRQKTLDRMQTAGERMSQAQTEGYVEGLPDEVTGPNVRFRPDGSEVQKYASQLRKTAITVPVIPRPLSRQLS